MLSGAAQRFVAEGCDYDCRGHCQLPEPLVIDLVGSIPDPKSANTPAALLRINSRRSSGIRSQALPPVRTRAHSETNCRPLAAGRERGARAGSWRTPKRKPSLGRAPRARSRLSPSWKENGGVQPPPPANHAARSMAECGSSWAATGGGVVAVPVILVGAKPTRATIQSPPRRVAIQLTSGSAARLRSTSAIASSRVISSG